MIVITVPLVYPLLASWHRPTLFGVIVVIYVVLGQISPPIGINLFVIQSIGGKLTEVVLGTSFSPNHVRCVGVGDRLAGAVAVAASQDVAMRCRQ